MKAWFFIEDLNGWQTQHHARADKGKTIEGVTS
jgi:hypothetical protein